MHRMQIGIAVPASNEIFTSFVDVRSHTHTHTHTDEHQWSI